MVKCPKFTIQFLIGFGIIFIICGLVLHTLPSSEIRANFITLKADSYWIEEIDLSETIPSTEYSLQLTFNNAPGEFNNFSYEFGHWNELILNESNSYSLNDTESLYITKFYSTFNTLQNFSFVRVNGEILESGRYYLVLINNNPTEMNIFYSMSIISQYYNLSIGIILLGSLFLAIGIFFRLDGWKKYLVLGISINWVLFCLRVLLFPHHQNLNTISLNFIDLELYDDFMGYYIPWSLDFMQGLWPYSSAVPSYIYSPLFYVMVGLTGYLPLPSWIIALPIFLCNMGTGILIFKILFKLTDHEKTAQTAMLYYYINPFVMIYGSFMWFNPPPFIFGIVLGYYLLLNKRYIHAMVTLGMAAMFKQFAVVFFPIALIFIFKLIQHEDIKSRIKKLVLACIAWFLPILMISLPFLIYDANGYITRLLSNNIDFSANHLLGVQFYDNEPVSFVSFFKLIGSPTWVQNALAWVITAYLPLIICFIVVFFWYMKRTTTTYLLKQESSPAEPTRLILNAIFFSLILAIGLQLFYPRGSYKYYMLLFVPFMTMLYNSNYHITDNEEKIHPKFYTQLFIGFSLSWIILYINRYIYLLILLGWLFYLMYNFRKEEKIK